MALDGVSATAAVRLREGQSSSSLLIADFQLPGPRLLAVQSGRRLTKGAPSRPSRKLVSPGGLQFDTPKLARPAPMRSSSLSLGQQNGFIAAITIYYRRLHLHGPSCNSQHPSGLFVSPAAGIAPRGASGFSRIKLLFLTTKLNRGCRKEL